MSFWNSGGTSNNPSGNNSSSTNNWAFGGGGGGGNNNSGNNQSNTNQNIFITRSSKYDELPHDKKKPFLHYERRIVKNANDKQQKIAGLISGLEQLPDITLDLRGQFEQIKLLEDKIQHYQLELTPFNERLRREFSHANQVQIVLQRNRLISGGQMAASLNQLPPEFYWDKVQQFQDTLNAIRSNITELQQHISDVENSPNMSPQAIVNALQSTYRTTLNIASKVVHTHNQLQQLKTQYKKYRLEKFGDTSDPFDSSNMRQRELTMGRIQTYVKQGEAPLEKPGLQEIDIHRIDTGTNNNSNNNANNNWTANSWNGGNNNNNNSNSNNNNNNSGNNNNNANANNNNNNNSNNNNNGNNGGFTFTNNSASAGFSSGSFSF